MSIGMDPLLNGALFSSPKLGLQSVGTNYKLNGRNFSGLGINHYALCLNELADMGVGGIGGYSADITAIKRTWGLPFIRTAFGWYDRTSWYTKYYQQKAAYFAALDQVVAKCEAEGVGLMPSLFWSLRGFCDMTFDVYGTLSPMSALSNKSSNAWALMAQYVTEVVTRYKDSPAIWAWDFGNETVSSCGPEYYPTWVPDGTTYAFLNWGARPGGGTYTAADMLSMQQWRVVTQNVIELIRSIDPYGRFISSGTAMGNSFAVNTQTSNTLTADTLAQWNSSVLNMPWVIYRDVNFEGVCGHIYPQSLANSKFYGGAEKTHAELIALSKGWADAANRTFFLQEFGATFHGDPVDETSVDLATETANFQAALDAIKNSNVQLAAAWNYGGNFAGGSAWMKWKMNDPAKIYQMTMLATANAAMSN